MKVAILCEFSGIVRDAFIHHGYDATSYDLLPSERPGPHIQGDILDYDFSHYDLIIAHPPCTHLAVSGARWFKDKIVEQNEALLFVQFLFSLTNPYFCLENPISIISSRFRRPNQIIQPWQFGIEEKKAICLWTRNLPTLKPTSITETADSRIHELPPSRDRWRERSRFYPTIANAMAQQWGSHIHEKELVAYIN